MSVTIFFVTEGQVREAAQEQGISLSTGRLIDLCEEIGDELDRRVPEIIKDVVGNYVYEREL